MLVLLVNKNARLQFVWVNSPINIIDFDELLEFPFLVLTWPFLRVMNLIHALLLKIENYALIRVVDVNHLLLSRSYQPCLRFLLVVAERTSLWLGFFLGVLLFNNGDFLNRLRVSLLQFGFFVCWFSLEQKRVRFVIDSHWLEKRVTARYLLKYALHVPSRVVNNLVISRLD